MIVTSRRRVSDAVFISPAGTRLLYCNVSHTFVQLVERAGLQTALGALPPDAARPAPQLRGAHAARAGIATASRSSRRLPLLSTYLGHVHPKDTYWYLSAAPELLALAAGRLERSQEGQP